MTKTNRNSQFDSIRQIISAQARNNPSKAAISAPGRSPLSYAHLQALIETNLAILNRMGIGRGDRVAIVLPNGPEMATAFLAVAAGATAAPLNPAYQEPEFKFFLADLKAKALLIQAGTDSPARQVATQLSIPIIELIPCLDLASGIFTLSGATAPAAGALNAGPNDEALVLHTSGTTSRPKIVPLSQRNICTSAQNIVATLALTADDRCLNIMPLFHIHGLTAAIMASLSVGAEVICSPGFNRDRFFDWLRQCRPTWYTAVPTMHMAILEAAAQHREAIHSVPLRFLRSSSASLPPLVMLRLQDVFHAPVIEAYSMTEAAHQMTSNPLPPAVRKAGSVGRPAGPEVAIMDDTGLILAAGEMGEIVIRGDNVTAGYENNPQANANSFYQGWFRTGDQGRMDEDGYLYITGRLKEIIIRGGEKISPREVDEALLDHPDVLQAVAFALHHDSLGEDVAAAVVLKEDSTLTANELRQGLFGRLAEFKIPNRILIVNEIPKGPTGKVQRIGLADKMAGQFQDGYTAPRNTTEELLAAMFKEVLGDKLIGVHDNFFSAGGDSLSGARVISKVRSLFLCDLPITALFRYPTISELARIVSQNAQPETPTIPQRKDRAFSPLSLAQQRLSFLEQLGPEHSINNIIKTLHLRGYLDQAALEIGINKIIGRHEILRTTFSVHEGEAMQDIAPHFPFTVMTIDLKHLSPDQQKDEAKRIASIEAHHSFDLARPPLIRAVLLQLGQQEHVLIITLHHIIADGWSRGIFSRELEAFYRSTLLNVPVELPKLRIQYADYAEWQRNWLQGVAVTPLIDYWKKQLSNATRLELPSDRPHAKQPDLNTALCSLQLSAELTKKIRRMGQEENCTLFMTLLACFNVLLHRYTSETDIVIGAPISGRHGVDEIKDLIGLFINTLPLRTGLSGDPSFRQMLGRVRKMALEAYRHSTLPFDKLVEILRPDRPDRRNPLFDIMINIHEASWHEFRLDGLEIEEWRLAEPLSDSALSLEVVLDNDRLHLNLKYQPALFDESRINRMLEHLKTLLEGCTASPDQSIAKLPLLTEAEQHQILKEWNDTGRKYPSDKCIHALFEEQAMATPDAVALTFHNQQMCYGQLNARANQLAHLLIARGIEMEQTVALLMERSMELLISILAILKAGGAYLPLDPKDPWERLQTILDDAVPKLLLTTGSDHESLTGQLTVAVLNIDTLKSELDAADQRNPNAPISPGNLAYVLYTSGSTGIPKGVMIEHGSVINLACALQTHVFDNSDKRPLKVALNTAITFDASVQQWTRLLWGDCIVMLPEEVIHDTQAFVAALRTQRADVLGCTPTQLRLLFDEGLFNDAQNCPAIVLCGGEAIDDELWRLASTNHRSHIFNVYGPTECTVDATCCLIDAKTNVPNIGRPLANVQAYILDRNRNSVPIGIPGELWLGGAGVGRGYLNKPELTASSFIPDPYANSPDARLYKTGDLARYLPDGNIEYLGRIDFQVKLRGYRIELGEIESLLRQHASVKDAVVIIREDAPHDGRLTAYVTPSGTSVDTGELRHILASKLPEYMVPVVIVCLDAFPLTSSGKTDRKALPVPTKDRSQLGHAFTPPNTFYEKKIAAIWSEIMGLDNPGIHDNFFELGGHSLLATRVIARINRAFGSHLPLRNLFESPSIAGLARALQELALNEQIGANPFIAIPRQQYRTKAPLSFAQQRLWFLDQLYPGKADYNLPQLLQLDGPLNTVALCNAINAVIKRHEALRTTFATHGDETQQHIAPQLVLELPLVDLHNHEAQQGELQRLIDEETDRPFDLAVGPLLRAKLFRLASEKHTLLVTLHHIVSDGWSMDVFNRELGTLYNAICSNQPSPLPELQVQYLDYAFWQQQQTDSLQQQVNYWQQQLKGAPQMLELPTDKLRPTIQSFNGKRYSIDLPPQLSDAVKRLAQHENATLFMVLLSTYQLLLHRYSGQDDILVGTPIAGRTQAELEPLIGFFVNSLVIRTRFAPQLTFRQLLSQVRETSIGAFSHQELPFEKLVETLTPLRNMSRNPIFQAMFSLKNDDQVLPHMDQLSVRSLDLGINGAKFDLTLFVSEMDNGLRATFNYASDLFDDATIERMAGHYVTLLTAIVENPDQAVTRLQLLTGQELMQLAEWSSTRATFDAKLCIQSIFERQAALTPDAVALSVNEQEVTYRDLNRRANRLAHYLIQQGVQPESRIALCLDRGIDAVVALLGIIKAGGAYLPMDASYPEERLRFMFEDSEAILVLTHNGLMPQTGNSQVIDMDQVASEINVCDDSNPAIVDDPERLLYVMYTSGSTGTPKGVEVPHRAVSRLVKNSGFADLGARQTFLLLASLSFDASTFEIWGPLLNGGRCVIYPERLPEFDSLARVIRNNGVTTLWLTASLFNRIIDEAPQTLAGVRQLLTGGEALSVDHIRRAQQALPDTEFINGYGPTENTTFTCCYRIPRPLGNLLSIPIGRPIGYTKAYVLDAQMQCVPIGVPGELYAGGAGLAKGYLNRSELTAERFVVNPFATREKLYKTGDLVRYLSDGNIEYLGRIDFQIKLRGYRIEPGEIETVLRHHDNVNDCVVMLREDIPGEKRLVAYVTTQPGQTIDEQTLRLHLKALLPEYMVPAAFVILDKVPLTPNGKVDRKALPIPSSAISGAGMEPRNTLEFHLAKIWEDVLNRKPIGVRDNFFELGGHSLLAVRLFDQIEKHFGKKLPLDTLWFEAATIETLAGILKRERQTILWPELVQIKAGGNMTPLYCIHTMGGNLFHYYELARALSPQLPVFGLQARGVYGKHAPRDNIHDIASDCIEAMRQRQSNGPYRIAGFSSGGIVAFEMAQQLHAAGEKVSCLALLDCYAPGIKRKGEFWRQFHQFITLKNLRGLQEQLYHRILHPLGLRRLRQMYTIGETHRWAHWSYIYEPYAGRIDLFVAAESKESATDPLLGWSKVAKGDLVVHSVPGTHGLLVKTPYVDVLAEKLQHILDQNNQ